jgi:hypothetical protein
MAGFWDWRTSSSARVASPPVAETTAAPTLEPVEIYTATAMVYGLVEPAGRRLSDMLNTNGSLAIRDARSTSLVTGVEGTDGDGWSRLPTDEILFVMPPKHESPRQLRIHRRQHRVRIETGHSRSSATRTRCPASSSIPMSFARACTSWPSPTCTWRRLAIPRGNAAHRWYW